MKANPDKCHFLCSSNREVSLWIIKNNKFEKLLGIKLDSKLIFNSHIHDIWENAGQKRWFSCDIAHYGKSLISVFEERFINIDKIFILPRRWALAYHSMRFRDFLDISYFLIS